MQSNKNNSFKKFYIAAVIAWIILLLIVIVVQLFIVPSLEVRRWINLFNGITQIIFIFGLFGIPLIVLLSFPIRIGEKIINFVHRRVNDKKKKESD